MAPYAAGLASMGQGVRKMPNAVQEKLANLAERLLEWTLEGRVSWQATHDEEAFAHVAPGGSVTIRTLDANGDFPHILELFDHDGAPVDKICSHRIPAGVRSMSDREWEPRPFAAVLAELWDAARAQALNIDAIVDSIIETIEPSADRPGRARVLEWDPQRIS